MHVVGRAAGILLCSKIVSNIAIQYHYRIVWKKDDLEYIRREIWKKYRLILTYIKSKQHCTAGIANK